MTLPSPEISYQAAEKYGWFSMAADLIQKHAAYLKLEQAPTNVIRIDDHRKKPA